MAKKRNISGAILASLVVLGACSNAEAAAPTTTIDFSLPVTSSTTTTTPTTTTTAAPETTTTTTTAAPGDASGIVLTFAEEGTIEADIERAFWIGNVNRRQVYAQVPLDPNYAPLLASHTGRELERIQEALERWIEESQTATFPLESETVIEFIEFASETEALVQVCELDRASYFVDGELTDDADIESSFQALFVLEDGEWLWARTTSLLFEELPEGGTPSCFA